MMHTCWLCKQRDDDERLEREDRPGKRARHAHLSCKEESAYLLDDFLKYEAPRIQR